MGRKVIAYHGSNNLFEQFDYNFIGSATSTAGGGPGFYFATDVNDSKRFGNYIYECELTLLKSLDNHKIKAFKPVSTIVKLLNRIYKEYGDNYYENFGHESFEEMLPYERELVAMDIQEYAEDDIEIISGICNSAGLSYEDMFKIINGSWGYNFTKDVNQSDTPHYIMYNPKDIKILKVHKI